MKTKTKLEYIWLDGYSPQNIRSKIKIINSNGDLKLKDIPDWSFDGSSTKQALGNVSDCILKPVRLYNNSFDAPDHWDSSYFVLCEVHKHHTNTRAKLRSYEVLLNRHEAIIVMSLDQMYGELDDINKYSPLFAKFYKEQMDFMKDRWKPRVV